MAIQELSIYGYRSLREVTWRPGQLNLVVGPNATGKSNLLRAIELISVAARGDLEDTITAPHSGGVIPLLWDHRPGEFGWKVRIDPVDEGRDVEKDALTYCMSIGQFGRGSGYEIKTDSLGRWYKFKMGSEKSPDWIFTREAGRAYIFDINQSQLIRLEEAFGTGSGDEGFDASESLLPQISDVRNRIPALTRRTFDAWRVYHDVHAERGSAMRQPATTQVATKLNPDGSNLATVLHTLYTGSRDFKKLIDEGMRAGFGNEYVNIEFQQAAQQIQLAVRWKSSNQLHTGSDLSDGTLRFLFLLTVLCDPESPQVVAIDEPEAGLHPSMLPIIAEYASLASSDTQIILTTHSPEFLDAFSELSPSVTICHWEDGETSLHPLDADELAVWLERYRLGELFSRGDLDSLAMPAVETSDDLESRLDSLPSQDEALASPETP